MASSTYSAILWFGDQSLCKAQEELKAAGPDDGASIRSTDWPREPRWGATSGGSGFPGPLRSSSGHCPAL